MNELIITQRVQAAGGPTIQEILEAYPGVYDVIDVTLGVVSDFEINLSPDCEISLLCIMVPGGAYDSGWIYAPVPYVSYKIGASVNPAIELDRMQMFVGVGAIAAIAAGAVNPTKLFLTNTHSTVEVKIIVGRSANPL